MKLRKQRRCDACGEGNLHPIETWDVVEYKGNTGKIRTYHSVCDVCGADLSNAEEVLFNRREWVRFRKEIDNIPMGVEVAAMRKARALTQEHAGRLFGGGPIAFSKYENDDLVPDEAMANLLYMAIRHPELVKWLAERKGFRPVELYRDETMAFEVTESFLKVWKIEKLPSSSVWGGATDLFQSTDQVVMGHNEYSVDYSKGVDTWQLENLKPH